MNWPVPVCPFRCWSVWPFRRRWPVCVVGRPWTASRDECRGEPAPEGQLSRPPATMTDGRRSGSVYRPPALRPAGRNSGSCCCYRSQPRAPRYRWRGGCSQRMCSGPSGTSVCLNWQSHNNSIHYSECWIFSNVTTWDSNVRFLFVLVDVSMIP